MAERTGDAPALREQFSYRARKWALQQVTSPTGADQHDRIASEDWDVLLVLDACRLDSCREVADWPVECVTTPASCTPEWLEQVADASLFSDAALLTANPQYEKFDIAVDCIELFWETHWNSSLQTVLPEPLLERSGELLAAGQQVVTHLQQPHWPYVAKIDQTWQLALRDLGPWETAGGSTAAMQVAMARGAIDADQAARAYRASVRSIWETLLPYVDSWVADGHTVIVTADHGETFGRLREGLMYEHPCNCHLPSLTNVPWVEFSPAKRHETDPAGDTVASRLQALGYTE